MAAEDDGAPSERKQTDESLRAERELVDERLGDKLAAIDETADAVLGRARTRADALLAAARAKTDRQSADPAPTATVERQRVQEDRAIRKERANADEVTREERDEHVAVLADERQETDKDLSSERARADDTLATRDEFLGIVSHDLLNMLNAMTGFAALIESAVSSQKHSNEILMHAQRIQRTGTRMHRLIGDLLDIASIDAATFAVTREAGDPTPIVMEAVDTFHAQAAACGISLAAKIASPSPVASFDPARILQVITNLLSNAIKFTPATGKVVVEVDRIGDELRFAVSDTGVGIPNDKLEAVFQRFLQVTKNDRRGVGLGLYISKCIVLAHGGRIWAESTLGKGSTFYFTLPIVARPPA